MADNKQGQSQDPDAGQGQGDQVLSAAEFNALKVQLKAAQDKATVEEDARKRAELQARTNQSQLDTLRARVIAPQNQAAPGQGQQVTPAQKRLQELEQLASEQARELLLNKEMAARGLLPADVENLTFDTPTELRLGLDMIQMKKETAEMRSQAKKQEQGASQFEPDAGGMTGSTGSPELPDEAKQLYDKSRKLGRTAQARWALLDAIHQDPSKIIPK